MYTAIQSLSLLRPPANLLHKSIVNYDKLISRMEFGELFRL